MNTYTVYNMSMYIYSLTHTQLLLLLIVCYALVMLLLPLLLLIESPHAVRAVYSLLLPLSPLPPESTTATANRMHICIMVSVFQKLAKHS